MTHCVGQEIDVFEDTPIFLAVQHSHAAVIKDWHFPVTDPNDRSNYNAYEYSFAAAIRSGSTNILHTLLSDGKNPGIETSDYGSMQPFAHTVPPTAVPTWRKLY